MGNLKKKVKGHEVKPSEPCKGCGEEIVGFASAGYCEDCLCPECGNTLETENERSLQICEDCEMGQFEEDD